MAEDWRDTFGRLFDPTSTSKLHLVGVGNPIRGDDAVGLFIISNLRKGGLVKRCKQVKVHPIHSSPELLFSKLNEEKGNLLIFDAVECNLEPGAIVLARLTDTKYGFFATHNIPLRLIPSLSQKHSDVFILGIRPENTEIGETLTASVKASAYEVINTIRSRLGGGLSVHT